MIRAARRRLAQGPWDDLSGGTESDTSLRRNRLAFDRLALRPRVLVDVSSVDRSATFLGHRLRIPVRLAPRSCGNNAKDEMFGGCKLLKYCHTIVGTRSENRFLQEYPQASTNSMLPPSGAAT